MNSSRRWSLGRGARGRVPYRLHEILLPNCVDLGGRNFPPKAGWQDGLGLALESEGWEDRSKAEGPARLSTTRTPHTTSSSGSSERKSWDTKALGNGGMGVLWGVRPHASGGEEMHGRRRAPRALTPGINIDDATSYMTRTFLAPRPSFCLRTSHKNSPYPTATRMAVTQNWLSAATGITCNVYDELVRQRAEKRRQAGGISPVQFHKVLLVG